MYAVNKTGGKQYRVQAGDLLVVEKLDGEPGAEVAFGDVLMLGDGEAITLGAPLFSGLDITIEDLSKIGWDFDIEAERKAVVDADALVFEFPLYWYSYPALLKKWVEEVLAHGFAYGTGGTALQGKDFFISSTTGGPEESYSHEGPQNHPISEFFFNFDQLATFTGMKKHEPIITYGCMYVPGLSTEEDKQKIVDNCKASAQKLIEELKKI